MKFSSYNPVVNPNTLQNISIRGMENPDRYYQPKAAGAEWKALGEVANIGLALQKDVVDGKVLEANAEYNKRMSEATSALMQKKEGAALNITEEYDKLQKRVFSEVQDQYRSYLYGPARDTFRAYTTKDDATRRAGVVKYQAGQTEAFAETQYNNQLAECRATALENGGGIENVAEALNRMDAVVDLRYGSYGGEKVTEQKRIASGKIVGDAVSMAIDTGDFAKAEALVSQYRDILPTNAYIDARSKIQKQKEVRNEYFTIDAISNRFRGADGKIDLARGFAEIDRICGPDAVKESGVNVNVPAAAEYIVGEGVSNPQLNNLTEQKLRLLDRDYYQRYGQHLYITSMSREGDGSSWHDSGQAIDTADDNLEMNKDARDWIVAQGEKYGLYALDEYENPSEHATGGHIHFSDHGEALEGGGGYVSAYDPVKREKLRKMLKAQYDSENAMAKQNESAAYDQLLHDAENSGDYASAYDMIINSDLPTDRKNRAVNVMRARFGVRPDGTPRGTGSSDATAKDEKAINKAVQLSRVMDVKLSGGKNPTAKEWVEMKDAADLISDSGMMTEEQIAELSDVYGVMGMVADYIDEGHSVPETYDWLLKAGASPTVAFIAISNLDRNYRNIGTAIPLGEEEEEAGGTY